MRLAEGLPWRGIRDWRKVGGPWPLAREPSSAEGISCDDAYTEGGQKGGREPCFPVEAVVGARWRMQVALLPARGRAQT